MRGNNAAFSDGTDFAIELGIPQDEAEEIAGSLCCSPYGEGPCSEESVSIIRAAADKYQSSFQENQ